MSTNASHIGNRHVFLTKLAVLVWVFVFFSVTLAFADHQININTADKPALETLSGIGPSKAQAIIDYRTQNGPFATIEEINNVSGIGDATYNNIKDHITVSGGVSTVPSETPATTPAATPTPAPGTAPSATSDVLTVDAGGDRVVIVGADAQFTARAYRNKTTVENAAFMWNFGDGSTAQGESVLHRFEYVGRHVVIMTGSKDGASATDRFTVTAESAQLALQVQSDGSVEIKNLAPRDIDLSHWIIRSAGQRFVLADNSLILADQTMRISPNVLHFYAGNSTELAYPDGVLAFSAGESPTVQESLTPVSPASKTIGSPASAVRKNPTSDVVKTPKKVEEEEKEVTDVATSSQIAAVSEAVSGSWKWWMGAFGLAVLAAGAVVVSRRFGKKEWNIVEDTSE